jgi:hypothetical protein
MGNQEEFKESKKEINNLYKDLESIVEINPHLYIMPVELYDKIMKKMGHMEDRIKKQTASLMMHIKDKQELRRKIKTLNSKWKQ